MTEATETKTAGLCVGSDKGKTHRAHGKTVNGIRYLILNCSGRAIPAHTLFVTGSGDLSCKACLKKEI